MSKTLLSRSIALSVVVGLVSTLVGLLYALVFPVMPFDPWVVQWTARVMLALPFVLLATVVWAVSREGMKALWLLAGAPIVFFWILIW